MRGDEGAVAALEELAPLGRDPVRVLEVVLEQQPRVAGVQPVDVVPGHVLVERVLGDDRDRHPAVQQITPAITARRRSAGCGRTSAPRSARAGPRPARAARAPDQPDRAREDRQRREKARDGVGRRPAVRVTALVRAHRASLPRAWRTRSGVRLRPPPRGTGRPRRSRSSRRRRQPHSGSAAGPAPASRPPRAAPARHGSPTRRPSRDRRPGSSGSRA